MQQRTSANHIQSLHVTCFVVRMVDDFSQYLLLRRKEVYLSGSWQMVVGGIEESETSWQAAKREVQEETGLTPDRLYSADAIECFYFKPLDRILLGPAFVAFIETGQEVHLSNEHDDFRWVSYEEALEMLKFSEQRRILKQIEENYIQKTPDPFFLIDCLNQAPDG